MHRFTIETGGWFNLKRQVFQQTCILLHTKIALLPNLLAEMVMIIAESKSNIFSNKWNLLLCFLWVEIFFQNNNFAIRVFPFKSHLFFELVTECCVTTIACQKNHTPFNDHYFIDSYLHGRFDLLASLVIAAAVCFI